MATALLGCARVDSRLSLRWLSLVVLLALAVYLCWQILLPFLNVLLWAVVLAVVFAPVHARIARRIARPTPAAALSTLLVVVTILVPVTFITIAVVNEARGLAASLGAHEGPWLDPNSPWLGPVTRWLAQYVNVDQLQSPEFIRDKLQALSGSLAVGTLGIVGGVLAAVVQMFLVIFTLFYLFRDGAAISRAAAELVPLEEQQIVGVVSRTRDVIAASVYGVVMISAIQGALGFFIFWTLGLPSALLWGVVMFFLSMIPMAGAFLVWAPAAIYLAATGTWGKALILVIWGVLVVGSIDNVLSPRLVGRRASMHELLIFFSVLGGIQLFGVLGVVLGPVVIAVTLALVDIMRATNAPRAPIESPRSELQP
jgi:predicted PurR-regulated permease PerM